MCPKGYPSNIEDVKWSEWVESVSKDVECTFGLKARWRWLRSEILYKDRAIIGYAMKTAAILHNVLLRYDNLETLNSFSLANFLSVLGLLGQLELSNLWFPEFRRV